MKNLHATLRYFSAGIVKIQGGTKDPFNAKYANIKKDILFILNISVSKKKKITCIKSYI